MNSAENVATMLLADFTVPTSWSSCAGIFQCSALTVPLDYANPAGQAPGLSRATDQPSHFGSPQQADFDIVGFDPRSVGHSAPITCLSDTQLDHYFALDPAPLSGSACA